MLMQYVTDNNYKQVYISYCGKLMAMAMQFFNPSPVFAAVPFPSTPLSKTFKAKIYKLHLPVAKQ
jgi:hypothetical protein